MLGAVRKRFLFVALLAVSFAVGFVIGVSMWEGEPSRFENSKNGEQTMP